jgi:hypothetical protein
MGDLSKGVAHTLEPAKTIYKKKFYFRGQDVFVTSGEPPARLRDILRA